MKNIIVLVSFCITLPTLGMIKNTEDTKPGEEYLQAIELPMEIHYKIANNCISTIKDTFLTLNALSLVSKQWYSVVNHETFVNAISHTLNLSPDLISLYKSQDQTPSEHVVDQLATNKNKLSQAYQDARYINYEFSTKKVQAIIGLLKDKIRQLFYTKAERIYWVYPDNYFLIQPAHYLPFVLSMKKPNNELETSFNRQYKCLINKVQDINKNLDKTSGLLSILGVESCKLLDPCIAIQSNKKIVIGLSSQQRNIFLIRFLMNGNLDISFGENGIANTNLRYSYQEFNHHYMTEQLLLEDLTINPQTNEIIFKALGKVKKYTADGKEIK